MKAATSVTYDLILAGLFCTMHHLLYTLKRQSTTDLSKSWIGPIHKARIWRTTM